MNEAIGISHQKTNPSTKGLTGILESGILGPSLDCISQFLAESQTWNQTACGRALCSTLEVDPCIQMVLGKISKLTPGILLPFSGIRALDREPIACLVEFFDNSGGILLTASSQRLPTERRIRYHSRLAYAWLLL
jgi:hypothetical protein